MEVVKKIISKIINFLKLLIWTIISIIKQIFFPKKDNKNIKKDNIKQTSTNSNKDKKEIQSDITTLPDEDNIKTNPHNNSANEQQSSEEDTTPDIILEIPKEKLYKVYNKDNELKYLTLSALLDLIVKEELENIYKEEKFKLKNATKEQLKQVEEIKERILPEIIIRVEKETLRTSDIIRKEVRIKLEYDLIEHPLFPKKEIPNPKTKEKNEEIYSLAINTKKEINIKEDTKPLLSTQTPVVSLPDNKKIKNRLDDTKVTIVQTTDEIPKQNIKDTLKNTAIVGATLTAGIIKEVITPPKEENTSSLEAKASTKDSSIEATPEVATIEQIPQTPKTEEIKEEIKTTDATTKEELEELKQKVEEKIQEIKEEKQKEEIKKEIEPELIKDTAIIAIAETSDNLIYESKKELQKEEFEDKDYDRIERQIDKMLEDITNTFLRYENKMSDKQKKKLQAEEEKLRQTKNIIATQKTHDIEKEIGLLTDPIRESEINGLQQELKNIHQENEQEVSNNLLKRMEKLEGMTKEQVANVDKRMMLKRLNKVNILLEMTSLLALPFVRNKYFFYFTVGLIIDNHFNFINAFFNRKMNKYEPADLTQIKQGQDALNGALDITFKNLVELDYLEQQALSRYPELANDPKFISQVTSVRTNLNQKYNKLMKKNKTMEKYYNKTKYQRKILKKDHKKNANKN